MEDQSNDEDDINLQGKYMKEMVQECITLKTSLEDFLSQFSFNQKKWIVDTRQHYHHECPHNIDNLSVHDLWTVLNVAICRGEIETVKYLLDECAADTNTLKSLWSAEVGVVSPLYTSLLHYMSVCNTNIGIEASVFEQITQTLIDHGANVNDIDAHFVNPPLILSRNCQVLVHLLLQRGANVNIRGANGLTALHKAPSIDVVLTLLNHGADVNSKDRAGFTALGHCEEPDVAKCLLDHGAEVNVTFESTGETALHRTQNPALAKCLLQYGADVNAGTTSGTIDHCWTLPGETALHRAETPEMVRCLIEHGANVNANTDRAGQTPLYVANKLAVIESLVENGADVNAVMEDTKETPIFGNPFVNSDPDIMKCLVENGASINNVYSRTGLTFLMKYVYCNDEPLMRYLLEHGADANAFEINELFNTLFETNSLDTARCLLEYGADVNARSPKTGNTALHHVNDAVMAKFLLEHGADPNIRNSYGFTPIFLMAYRYPNLSLVNVFMDSDLVRISDKILAYELIEALERMHGRADQATLYSVKAKELIAKYGDDRKPPMIERQGIFNLRNELYIEEQGVSVSDDLDSLLNMILVIERLFGQHSFQVGKNIKAVDFEFDFREYLFSDVHFIYKTPFLYQIENVLDRWVSHSGADHDIDARDENVYMHKNWSDFLKVLYLVFEHFHLYFCSTSKVDIIDPEYRVTLDTVLYVMVVWLFAICQKIPEYDKNIQSTFIQTLRRLREILKWHSEYLRSPFMHKIVKYLLEKCIGKSEVYQRTSFQTGKALILFMLHAGFCVHCVDVRNRCILHLVEYSGCNENSIRNFVDFLLENHAHIDVVDDAGNSAFSALSKHSYIESTVLQHVNLQCLAARVVAIENIQFEDTVSSNLRRFIKLHSRRTFPCAMCH